DRDAIAVWGVPLDGYPPSTRCEGEDGPPAAGRASSNAERTSEPAKPRTAVVRRIRDDCVALPPRRDRSHGGLARPHRQNHELGDHRRGGDAVPVAIDIQRASWRVDLRHAAGPSPALDRGASLSLLRRLQETCTAARTPLFRTAVF